MPPANTIKLKMKRNLGGEWGDLLWCAQHRVSKIQAEVLVLSKTNLFNFNPVGKQKQSSMPVHRQAFSRFANDKNKNNSIKNS
jgi:hypothetical protein